MSASCHSYATIGVGIDPKKLFVEQKERNCSCKEIDLTKRYCSECGELVYRVSSEPIKEFSDWEHLKGYDVFFSTNNAYAVISMIGTSVSSYSDSGCAPMIPIPADLDVIKNKMRDTLLPLGLWDETTFGLWCIQSWG